MWHQTVNQLPKPSFNDLLICSVILVTYSVHSGVFNPKLLHTFSQKDTDDMNLYFSQLSFTKTEIKTTCSGFTCYLKAA